MGFELSPPTRLSLGTALLCFLLACSAPESVESTSVPEPVRQISTDQQVIERFRKIWHGNKRRVFQNKFLGVPTLQNPLDVWVTQEIIVEVAPDFIVETGTFRGGSALLWAMILEHVNPEGQIITVDIEDGRTEIAKEHSLAQNRVEFVLGSSVGPRVVARIAERVKGKKVLVILDSNHSREHILKELNAYGPMVSPGSYLIVQDTMFGGTGAIKEYIARHGEFTVDASRERYILTNNRRGFLKRAK